MTQYINFMPGVCVIEPTTGPIDTEKFERNLENLKFILEKARMQLNKERDSSL